MNVLHEGKINRYRFPRKEILRKREEINSLLRKGNKLYGKWCCIFYQRCENRRVIFIVSKRVGKAVRRNKIKRWLRELYRLHRDISGDKVAIAFLITNDQTDLSFHNLKEDLMRLLPIIGNKFHG